MYQIIFRMSFEALDDIDARAKAVAMRNNIKQLINSADIKLQEVFNDKPPRGINLKLGEDNAG